MQEITVPQYGAAGMIKKKYKAKEIFKNGFFRTWEYINSKGNKRKYTESLIKVKEVQENE